VGLGTDAGAIARGEKEGTVEQYKTAGKSSIDNFNNKKNKKKPFSEKKFKKAVRKAKYTAI